MGALCSNCKINVGCACNLDANLLCVNCTSNNYIKKPITIEQKVYSDSQNKKTVRKLGYI